MPVMQAMVIAFVGIIVSFVMYYRFRRGRVGLRLMPFVTATANENERTHTSRVVDQQPQSRQGQRKRKGHADWRLWRRAGSKRSEWYPPVWIFVDRPPRDRQYETSVRNFEMAFCGYERVALLIAFARLARTNNIIFVHRGNWHALLGSNWSAQRVRAFDTTLDPHLRRDYIKYELLARHGGLWLTPQTVLVKDPNALLVAQSARRGDRTDLAVIAGNRPAVSGYYTTSVPDDVVVVCYPGNPVLARIAKDLRRAVAKPANVSNYNFEEYTAKQLLRFSSRATHGALADSIACLGNDAAGTVNTCCQRVTCETLLAAHPHTCVPHVDMQWLSLDGYQLERQRNHAWFARLSEAQLLRTELWVTHVYRQALVAALPNTFSSHGDAITRLDMSPVRNAWQVSWSESSDLLTIKQK